MRNRPYPVLKCSRGEKNFTTKLPRTGEKNERNKARELPRGQGFEGDGRQGNAFPSPSDLTSHRRVALSRPCGRQRLASLTRTPTLALRASRRRAVAIESFLPRYRGSLSLSD